jgi:predicted metal-dependent enzyme (double-stranded beta helix superfamily)
MPTVAQRRTRAVAALMRQVDRLLAGAGPTPTALHHITQKLVGLARRADLFPAGDFAAPVAQGRSHPLAVSTTDGPSLYLTHSLPGKQAAPHDHGIWCIAAAISGRERHILYRRTDDASRPGHATVEPIGETTVEPGQGFGMADHDIHATEVLGDQPAIGLALYGYPLVSFPAVTWFHLQWETVRTGVSRRHRAVA